MHHIGPGEELDKFLSECLEYTKKIVDKNWQYIEEVAQILLDTKVVSGKTVLNMVNGWDNNQILSRMAEYCRSCSKLYDLEPEENPSICEGCGRHYPATNNTGKVVLIFLAILIGEEVIGRLIVNLF